MPTINCDTIKIDFLQCGEEGEYVLNNAAHLWKVEISANLDLIKHSDVILCMDEQSRAEKYHHEHNTQRFIVSRVALRILLGRYLQMPPQDIIFVKGVDKKPFIQNTGDKSVHYNVSHSGNCILIAISSSPVGVDVEYIDTAFAFGEVLPVCFSNAEAKEVGQSRSVFYKLWTRKEALRKATAKGIDDELALVPCLDGVNEVDEVHIGSSQNWQVSSFETGQQYIACIAYVPSITEISFIEVKGLLPS